VKFKTNQAKKKLIAHRRSLEKQVAGLFKKLAIYRKYREDQTEDLLIRIKIMKDKIWTLKGKRQGRKR
jgi:hypothetical protein